MSGIDGAGVMRFGVFGLRVPTPDAERKFIAEAIAPALKRLHKDPLAIDDFLGYARKHGADPLLFPGRLAKVLKGESPAPFLVALLITWSRR